MKSFMIGAVARKGASWFTNPYHDLMSEMEGLSGMLKFLMAARRSSVCLYLSQPRRKPTKSTSLRALGGIRLLDSIQ